MAERNVTELDCDKARRIVYDLPVGIACVDAAGMIVWANSYFAFCTDYSEGQLLAMRFESLIDPSFKQRNTADLDRVRSGKKPDVRSVTSLLKAGSVDGQARACGGLLQVSRHPIVGDFQEYWIAFVPFDQQASAQCNPKQVLAWIRENYTWLATIATLAAALAAGNWQRVSEIINQSVDVRPQNEVDGQLAPSPLPTP